MIGVHDEYDSVVTSVQTGIGHCEEDNSVESLTETITNAWLKRVLACRTRRRGYWSEVWAGELQWVHYNPKRQRREVRA